MMFISVERAGEPRSVMYKGFPSELFVPYMDPEEGWYYKAYMDAGELGLGPTAMSLVPLNDCPRNAYYIYGVFASPDGSPIVQHNMICLFERYAGDISWRHSELLFLNADVSPLFLVIILEYLELRVLLNPLLGVVPTFVFFYFRF